MLDIVPFKLLRFGFRASNFGYQIPVSVFETHVLNLQFLDSVLVSVFRIRFWFPVSEFVSGLVFQGATEWRSAPASVAWQVAYIITCARR